VIAGALGAATALAAHALGRPDIARAGSDGDVVLGTYNYETMPTYINSTGSDAALDLSTSSATGWALKASSTAYPAVFAQSSSAAAFYGTASGTSPAVLGQGLGPNGGSGVTGTAGINYSTAPDYTGVFGYGLYGAVGHAPSEGHVGVFGYNGDGNPPTPVSATYSIPTGAYAVANGASPTGVWGEGGTATTGSSTGVYGEGDTGVWGYGGWGVFGASDSSGTGVYGFSGASVPSAPAHVGVFGYSDSGTGVYAKSASNGTALYVNGKARFSRSGRTSIAAGSSKKITLAGVTSSSYVIATLQTNRAGLTVQSVVCGAGSFTIYLNKSVSATTSIGYLVIN
jgi:hypothetical protein